MLMTCNSYKPGDLLWSEDPVVYALHVKSSPDYCAECLSQASQKSLFRCSRCKNVFYCGKKCQKSGWTIHKRECACIASSGVFPAATVRLLFNIISYKIHETDDFFSSLVSHYEELSADDGSRLLIDQAYAMLMMFSNEKIDISKADFCRLFGKVRINSFYLTNDSGDEIGVALFKRSAKLDHSCVPNADFAFVGKRIQVIASHGIIDPSQIRVSYVDLLMSTKRRRDELSSGYFFLCNCSRCSDVEQDFDSRIPTCCGRRMHGPLSGISEDQIAAWPSDANVFLPNLTKHSFLTLDEAYICGVCRKAYSAAIFDALESRSYEIDTFKDAVGLYKACVAATSDNEYFRLVYSHPDNLPLLRLCRVMVMTYKVDEDNLNGEELDLMLEVGLRLLRCFDSANDATVHSSLRGHLFVCGLTCAVLGLLASVIFFLQAHLSVGVGDGGKTGVSLGRLKRFSEAFIRTAVEFTPCIERFAAHLPVVKEQLERLRSFAHDLNVQL